jgi:hypothetical protein
MRTKTKWLFTLALAVLTGIGAASSPGQKLSFTVYVRNHASIESKTLRRAENVASRIFQNAGVVSHWVDAAEATAFSVQEQRSPLNLWVTILPSGMADRFHVVDGTAGLAIGEGPDRRLAYIFYDRVLEMQASVGDYGLGPTGASDFLGNVMAHEVGHILLDLPGHSPTGIMQEKWDLAARHEIIRGHLQFTDGQRKLIQMDVGRRTRQAGALIAKAKAENLSTR